MADPIEQARAAVEDAAKAAAAAAIREEQQQQQKKKGPTVGPVRYNLEAFGVAILGAVLLKWYCLEAFEIPTSSMQPTLMGSSEAGVYDRLLVDKFSPAIRAPRRWDVTVFGYPLQQNQNYVKRLVGLPGETMFIGGGNLYLVEVKDGIRKYTPLRKPDHIQEHIWKEVYPARLYLHEGQLPIGEQNSILYSIPPSAWTGSDPNHLTVQLEASSQRRLVFRDKVDGGFVDRVWDGYPTSTAQAIRERNSGIRCEIVPDGRIEAVFTPEQTVEELALEIEVRRPKLPTLLFAMIVKDGKCQLVAKSDDGRTEASAEKVCELPAGVGTDLAFAHVDDELIAWRMGEVVLRFDTSAFDCREGCELPGADGQTPEQSVSPQIRLKGQGKVTIDDLRISRDLHYTKWQEGFEHARDLIQIPADHYFMMGDNTLQSIDSRGWTAIEIGVRPDGTVVPPEEAKTDPQVKVLRGNKRPMPGSAPPDRDETPVVVTSQDLIMFIDLFGDTHTLKARAVVDPTSHKLEIQRPEGGKGTWQPPETWVPFVPRDHIRGRALVIFWRKPFPRFTPIR